MTEQLRQLGEITASTANKAVKAMIRLFSGYSRRFKIDLKAKVGVLQRFKLRINTIALIGILIG